CTGGPGWSVVVPRRARGPRAGASPPRSPPGHPRPAGRGARPSWFRFRRRAGPSSARADTRRRASRHQLLSDRLLELVEGGPEVGLSPIVLGVDVDEGALCLEPLEERDGALLVLVVHQVARLARALEQRPLHPGHAYLRRL